MTTTKKSGLLIINSGHFGDDEEPKVKPMPANGIELNEDDEDDDDEDDDEEDDDLNNNEVAPMMFTGCDCTEENKLSDQEVPAMPITN